MNAETKEKVVRWATGIMAAVVVLGIGAYFFHATDPAARGPIPYKPIDYGAYLQQESLSKRQIPPGVTINRDPRPHRPVGQN